MSLFEFHPTRKHVQPIIETARPYVKARIDSTDKSWYHHSHFPTQWARSTTCSTGSWQNESWIGLNGKNTASSCDFTKTITLPKNGYYRIEVMMNRGPSSNGVMQLYDGSNQIGNTILATSTIDQLKQRVQFRTYLKGGSHSFKLHITKTLYVAWIMIYKLDVWEGGDQHINDANTRRLDIQSGDFTQNTVSDSNLLNFDITMKEEFYDDNNPYSHLHFDYNDHITLYLGSDRFNARAMFGGYITDAAIDDENSTLTLGCQDRLLDFNRKPIYKNFKLGNPTVDTSSDTTPFTKFADAYSMIRALAQCPEYPLATYLVPYDYGFKQTFSTQDAYNSITSSVYRTEWDTKQGKPAPSLKIGLGDETGNGYVTLYQDNEGYDAYTYNHLNMSYYAGWAGSKYPLPFNIEIDMFHAGETIDDAITYTVHFNGPSVTSHLLTSVTPHLNGVWQNITLDLKALFNTKSPSSEYNITRIAMVGTVTSTMLTTQKCSTIWVDSILAYRDLVSTASYASQDVKTPFTELQDLCTACNLSAYVQYGDTRSDDVLVVQPNHNTVLEESIEEGRNLLEINNWEYNPLDDGFVNQRYCTFNINDKKTGSTYKEDHDSVLWYGAMQTFEHLDDINTQARADANAQNTIIEGAWKRAGSTVTIPGCTILQPGQYALSQVGTRRISGEQTIKAIKHEFKFVDETYYNTIIDLNRINDIPNRDAYLLKKDIRNSGNRHNTQNYTDYQLDRAAKSGFGAYQR